MIDVTTTKVRPKYLNVAKIRLPIPGFVSILHRVSGAGLFLLLPVFIWIVEASLASNDGFASVKSAADNPFIKLMVLAVVWALAHHFLAGIRYLLLDVQTGIDLRSARGSAWAVLGLSLVLTAAVGVRLW